MAITQRKDEGLRRIAGAALLLASLGLVQGCGGEDLEGFLWEVYVVGDVDTCHPEGEGVAWDATYDYILQYEGSYFELSLGPDTFATGTIAGCDIEYESVVWGEGIDGYQVRWQLSGDAVIRQGGSTCGLDAGVDWLGTETFEIVASDHPDIAVGCEYVMLTEGTYQGPL